MPPIKTTHLLISANVLVFVAMVVFGGREEVSSFSIHTLLVFGADYGPLVRAGQWYRPFTSTFIHLNPLHLVMNMVALYQVGIPLEELYGRRRYTFLYVLAGLAGSAVSLAWWGASSAWMDKAPVVSAGASGAITGLIGAAAVASHFQGERGLPLRNAMLRWLVMVFLFGIAVHADHAAHFGGLAGGAAIAYLFQRRRPRLRIQSIARISPRPAASAYPGIEALALLVLLGIGFGEAARRRDDAFTLAELVNRGVELAEADDYDGAIRSYRRAIALDPNDAIAQYDLALALAHTGAHDEAVAVFTKAMKLNPDGKARQALVDEHIRHAMSQMDAGKLDEAEAAVRAGLVLDDTDTDSLAALAHIQRQKKDYPGAIATLRAALAVAPTDAELKQQLARSLVQSAVGLARSDKHAEAVPLYREALQLEPMQHLAHYNLGLALYKMSDFDGARDAVERSVALHPSRRALRLLALVHDALGHPDAAEEARKTAESLPEDPP